MHSAAASLSPRSIRIPGVDLDRQQCRVIAALRAAWNEEILPRAGRVSFDVKQVGRTKELASDADRAASLKLLAAVKAEFPASYSEEHLNLGSNAPAFWQFDPLDGTVFFRQQKLENIAMQGALLVRNRRGEYLPHLAVLYIPAEDRMWFCDKDGKLHYTVKGVETELPRYGASLRGAGALRCQGIYGNLDEQQQLPSRERMNLAFSSLAASLGRPCVVLPPVSGGKGLSRVLSGEADLFVNHLNDSKLWDVAMAAALISAAGGFVHAMSEGRPFKNFHRSQPILMDGVVASIALAPREVYPAVSPDLIEHLA